MSDDVLADLLREMMEDASTSPLTGAPSFADGAEWLRAHRAELLRALGGDCEITEATARKSGAGWDQRGKYKIDVGLLLAPGDEVWTFGATP